MKLRLKEDPKEWRKAAVLSAVGLALLSTVLCWRHLLPVTVWLATLGVLTLLVVGALVWPRRFRGYYRFSNRLSFCLSQFGGRGLLVILFFVVLTPLGLVLRLLGKDSLRLKRRGDTETYWTPVKEMGPLDRLF